MMMMDEDGFNKRNILTLLLNFLIFAVSGKKKTPFSLIFLFFYFGFNFF
jgi:hypothetical protein